MAFNCTSPGAALDALETSEILDRQHSAFGDAYSVKSRSAGSLATFSRYHDEPEADYDEGATDLYRRIENKDWDGALSRLEQAPVEAKTWVSRRELSDHVPSGGGGRSGSRHSVFDQEKCRWRLLPLHAVCIFRAPLALIEALIEVYRDGPQMKDDQGMLPVHLACRNGASKGVVLTLLHAFPDSMHVRDRKNRSPMDLVEHSNSANREAVLTAMRRFKKEMEQQQQQNNNSTTTATTTPSPVVVQQQQQQSKQQQQQGIRHHSSPYGEAAAPALAQQQQQQTAAAFGGFFSRQAPPPQQVAVEPAAVVAGENVVVGGNGTMGPVVTENEVDYEHRTVLFRLILKKDWKPVAARAQAFPEEAGTWIVTKGFHGNLRFLPLHKACVLLPPEHVAQALLHAYPAAARSKDQDGWLPVHCACFYGSSERVIHCLLHAYPAGAQVKDDEGRLPLHYACLKGASQGVVDVLLASYAKGAMSKDDEGRLPIHHACSKGAPEGVIDALLKASPKGAQSKDDQGRLPLHHATRKSASERVVRTLLRVYPRAAQIKDDQDKLPIHYACQNGGTVAVVNLLLQTYPESIRVQNGFGYTPLAEAKALENPKMDAVIKVLTKCKQEQDAIRNTYGGNGGGNGDNNNGEAMHQKVKQLTDHVHYLESKLAGVAAVGKDLKRDVLRYSESESDDVANGSNAAALDILERLADRLLDLGSGGGGGGAIGDSGSTTNSSGGSTSGGSSVVPAENQKRKTPLKSRQTHAGSNTPGKGGLFGRKAKNR